MDNVEMRKLTRREREKERHRHEILEAAERVFVRKGYHLATVEEVAKESEFAVGSIYNFFGSKEELYLCVVIKIAEDFMRSFENEVLTKNDPEAAIASLIEIRLRSFESHRGFFRVFLETSPGGRFDPVRAMPPECARLYDRYIEAVGAIFQRGVRDGLFDPVDPLYLTLCLEGIVNAFVSYWSWHEPAEPLAERVGKVSEVFLGRIRTRPGRKAMSAKRGR